MDLMTGERTNEARMDGAWATGAQANGMRAGNGRRDTIEVEIGALVLDGFAHHVDRDRLAEAFTRELSRLVREHGVPLADARTGSDPVLVLDAVSGLLPLPHTASPIRLGTALARSVHAGLTERGHRPEPRRS